jgi:Cof subfamily protein (haloacid dehalogenase superfamily)
MIKGLILDVDGVLVGGKKGYNWPLPNIEVIQTLKMLKERGIVVSLCTGKGTFAIHEIVKLAQLDNVHIGDGGAILIDILHNTIIEQHTVDKTSVQEIVQVLLGSGIYVELYTRDGYYIQKNQISDKTNKHKDILYKEPTIVESIKETASSLEIIKIMPVADNEEQKKKIIELFSPYTTRLTLQWGVHPTALPYQFGIITLKGISKKQAALTISKHTGIALEEILGVGDGMTDWQFMEICGYAGAMGNASQELKDKVALKNGRGYVGKTVDDNGLLDILNHFNVNTKMKNNRNLYQRLFDGRINRMSYWMGNMILGLWAVSVVIGLPRIYELLTHTNVSGIVMNALMVIAAIPVGIYELSLGTRRAHDIGEDWQILSRYGIRDFINGLKLMYKKGDTMDNEYGTTPLPGVDLPKLFGLKG